MNNIRPIFGKLLIAAIVLYIISTTFILSDIYYKIGNIEHILVHMDKGSTCKH